MASFCIFGGYEGQLSPRGGVHVTIFGSAELRRPPVTQQILAQPRNGDDEGRTAFVTLLGAAELKWPTLAQEYLSLREALRTGVLTLAEWDRRLAQPGASDSVHLHSFTLFGSFDGNGVPSENEEVDDLGMQRHLGHIPQEAVEVLMRAIGQPGTQRLAAVRQAVVVSG